MGADLRLYKYFVEKHKRSVRKYGIERMRKDVLKLKALNGEILKACTENGSKSNSGLFNFGHQKIDTIAPNKDKRWCNPYFETELSYLDYIRTMNRNELEKRQILGTLEN